MTVTATWTNPQPGGVLDLATGATLTESWCDAMVSNFLFMGGNTGVLPSRHATAFVIDSGGLTVTGGNVGIGTTPSNNAGVTVVGTWAAIAGFAYGIQVQGTVSASANGDVISGIKIDTAFSPAAHSSVTAAGVNVSSVTGGNTNNYGVLIQAPSGASGNNVGLVTLGGIIIAGGLPTTGAGQFGMGGGTGLGNGATTNLQAPAIGTGTGPASLVATTWMQVSISGSTRWLPLFT